MKPSSDPGAVCIVLARKQSQVQKVFSHSRSATNWQEAAMNQMQEQNDALLRPGTQNKDSSTKVRDYSAAPCPYLRCFFNEIWRPRTLISSTAKLACRFWLQAWCVAGHKEGVSEQRATKHT